MRLPPPELDKKVLSIAATIESAGGKAYVVGGFVRDLLLSQPSKDLDVEVHHLPLGRLEEVLGSFGEVIAVGRAFGVLRLKGLDVDFSLPRTDSKRGKGHRGFDVECDPELGLAEAARRRDLTINSMALDPMTGEIVDVYGGLADLKASVLRATDPRSFADDPLRGIRVAQFAARFEMTPDAELVGLCRSLDLDELPGERLFQEFRKLLLKGRRPSVGLQFLRDSALLRFFPELDALIGVEQEPEWHPEGDVWVHTLMVIDEAARLRDEAKDPIHNEELMFGALCHDFGKPDSTERIDGRIRSLGHEQAGIDPTVRFMERLMAPKQLVEQVVALVAHHLAPGLFFHNGATPKAYRKLARKLDDADTTMLVLERVARADHFGRTTKDAIARSFPGGDHFLSVITELTLDRHPPTDVVLGRHLIERGHTPGPNFGEILLRCREIQDQTGLTDPDQILGRAGL